MIADIPQIVTALVISTVISVGAQLMKVDLQERLLEDNISVTKDLSKEVNNLSTQLAVFQEKYVTKEELANKLKEETNGPRNR